MEVDLFDFMKIVRGLRVEMDFCVTGKSAALRSEVSPDFEYVVFADSDSLRQERYPAVTNSRILWNFLNDVRVLGWKHVKDVSESTQSSEFIYLVQPFSGRLWLFS
jgi:hypothetical protein